MRTPAQMRRFMAVMSTYQTDLMSDDCTPGQPCKNRWVNPDGTVMSFKGVDVGAHRSFEVRPRSGQAFAVVVPRNVCRVGTPYCDHHRAIWDRATAEAKQATLSVGDTPPGHTDP